MRRFFRQAGMILTLLVLLPYIVTVFVNGGSVRSGQDGTNPYVTVIREEETKKMPLREYGIGVLAKEIQPEAGKEAVKAQAVLIRTSIYKSIQENGSDVVLDKKYWSRKQMEENWGGAQFDSFYKKFEEAWDETEGKVLMYEGKLALTPYHRLSNGRTRSGNEVFQTEDYPYLEVKECPEDLEEDNAMTTTLLQGTDMEVTKTDSAGYAVQVRCGEETVSGDEFRNTYHLVSSCFTLQQFDGQIRVICTGIGHGLGMSQNTAVKMAEEGKKFQEILAWFFEGTSLEEVAEILVKPE